MSSRWKAVDQDWGAASTRIEVPHGSRRKMPSSRSVTACPVMVAAGGNEQGTAAPGGLLEAEHVAVELPRDGEITHLQMDVAHSRACGHRLALFRRADGFRGEVAQVKRVGGHADGLAVPAPFASRSIAIDLEAVVVVIPDVERFADKMIGSAKPDAGLGNAREYARQTRTVGHEDRDVIEAGRILIARRRAGTDLEGEYRLSTDTEYKALGAAVEELQPHHVDVPAKRTVRLGDPQGRGADRGRCRQGGWRSLRG
jgi:hypothetical protein